MEVVFCNRKLEKACNEFKTGCKTWGEPLTKKIGQRLRELRAADNLSDISKLPPPRCHELKHNLARKFAVDLDGNNRLVFKPFIDPPPLFGWRH